jgi:hypothetical protein
MADTRTKIAAAAGLGLTVLGNALGIIPSQQSNAEKLRSGGEQVAQAIKQSQENKGPVFRQTTQQPR